MYDYFCYRQCIYEKEGSHAINVNTKNKDFFCLLIHWNSMLSIQISLFLYYISPISFYYIFWGMYSNKNHALILMIHKSLSTFAYPLPLVLIQRTNQYKWEGRKSIPQKLYIKVKVISRRIFQPTTLPKVDVSKNIPAAFIYCKKVEYISHETECYLQKEYHLYSQCSDHAQRAFP